MDELTAALRTQRDLRALRALGAAGVLPLCLGMLCLGVLRSRALPGGELVAEGTDFIGKRIAFSLELVAFLG